MSDLDALLAGIVADPSDALRWLVMADWLEDHGQPDRAELVRVHRELLRTCTATRETKARKQLHARMMDLMRAGMAPSGQFTDEARRNLFGTGNPTP